MYDTKHLVLSCVLFLSSYHTTSKVVDFQYLFSKFAKCLMSYRIQAKLSTTIKYLVILLLTSCWNYKIYVFFMKGKATKFGLS